MLFDHIACITLFNYLTLYNIDTIIFSIFIFEETEAQI